MTCNAIATIRAQIAVDEQIRQVIGAELFAQYISAVYQQIENTPPQRSAYGTIAEIFTTKLAIQYNARTGDLTIRARLYGTQADVDAALKSIPELLRKAVVAIMQKKAIEAVKALGGRIEAQQVTPSGAMVLTVDI